MHTQMLLSESPSCLKCFLICVLSFAHRNYILYNAVHTIFRDEKI